MVLKSWAYHKIKVGKMQNYVVTCLDVYMMVLGDHLIDK